MDLKNMNVNYVKAAVAWGMADTNVNIELAPDVSIHSGCLVDMSINGGNADYPMNLIHLIEGTRGHIEM
jgi:hypothetical protein